MKQYPQIPHISDQPELLNEGHLWVQEKVDGAHLRFQLQPAGYIRFGDRKRVYEDADSIPDQYGHAVRHVQSRLDRETLRDALDDVSNIVFFGEAMHQHSIDYDWRQTPNFLGFGVWSDADQEFRPPGATKRIFERLGLTPVNAFERELPARDFDPESYSVPASNWYDGPAEGVVVRDKRGHRGIIHHPEFEDRTGAVTIDSSATALAEEYTTEDRLERHARQCDPLTFEALYDRVLQEILREKHRPLVCARAPVDMRSFRSAVAERTQAFLDER